MPRQRQAPPLSDGKFSDDGQSFVIPRPDAGRPLVNVMSTGSYGVAVAQTGAGCSWGRLPAEPVTRGAAPFLRDAGGRALYLRDEKTGRSWSAGWQPRRARPDAYECIHGVGYTLITSATEGVQAQWLTFVPLEEPLEVWRVRLRNLSKRSRTVSLWTGVEWASAASAGDEASFVHGGGRILLAKAAASAAGGLGGVAFHAVNLPPRAHALDRRRLWGRGGSAEAPEALEKGRYVGGAAGSGGPFASLCVPFTLKPGEERSVLFTVGRAEAQSEALLKARKFQDFAQVDHAWNRTQMFWDRYLSGYTVETPDEGFNGLVNTWLKYQALSQGVWGGKGEKDGRIFLPLEPSRVRAEVLARAGTRRNRGAASRGEVPWPVLLLDYLRETGEGPILLEKAAGRLSLYESAARAVKGLSALPMEDGGLAAEFISDWGDMVLWAVQEGVLPARERASARKWKAAAARRRGPSSASSVSLLEEACARGRAARAWELFRAMVPPAGRGRAPALFAAEGLPEGPSAAALFRACTEGILGLKPLLNGLRVKPCLPPAWRGAIVRREFRGALYAVRIRRDASRPPGFQEVHLNGVKLWGNVLPPAFSRKNVVTVTVGEAG